MATEELDFDPVQPGAAEGDLLAPAAGTYVVVTQILLANTTGADATVTIGKNGVAAANQIVPAITIPANTTETLDTALRVSNPDKLRALQPAAAITVTLSGYVVTV